MTDRNMIRKPEMTSPRLAKLAARILASVPLYDTTGVRFVPKRGASFLVMGQDIKALAASCLTQAPDRRRVPTTAELDAAHAVEATMPKTKRARDNRRRDDQRRDQRVGSPFFPAARPKRSSP